MNTNTTTTPERTVDRIRAWALGRQLALHQHTEADFTISKECIVDFHRGFCSVDRDAPTPPTHLNGLVLL